MSSAFKTKEFKELFHMWNKILESSGHQEIEDFTLPRPGLKSWHNIKFKNVSTDKIYEHSKYYETRITILNTFEFESDTHKEVWLLHSEGFSCREIANKINKKKFRKSIIHAYIKIMEKKHGLGE